MMETPVGTPKEDLRNTLRASIFLIRRAMRDIVTSVSPWGEVPGERDKAPGVAGAEALLGDTPRAVGEWLP